MRIAGVIDHSLIEWRGHISKVLFVPGCNFLCPYCHASQFLFDSVSASGGEFLDKLDLASAWCDAVVLSGGEVTLQDDLSGFCGALRGLGYLVKLETNGSRPDVLGDLVGRGLVDCVAMDYKVNLAAYGRVAKVDMDFSVIKKSMDLLESSGVELEFHTTLWPGVINTYSLCLMAEELPLGSRWVWQRYNSGDVLDPVVAGVEVLSEDMVLELSGYLGEWHDIELRG